MAENQKPRRTQQKYIRNIRNVHVSLRLGDSDRRIELAPRGQRGDMSPLKKGDQSDEIYIANQGLFEVITAEEANDLATKQTTNEQRQRHPALATIRNAHGKEYEEDSINTKASENEDKSRVVAYTDKQAEGVGNIVIDRNVGIRRAPLPGTEDYSLPPVPDSVDPEDQAQWLADERARKAQSAEDLGLKVTKDEPQQT